MFTMTSLPRLCSALACFTCRYSSKTRPQADLSLKTSGNPGTLQIRCRHGPVGGANLWRNFQYYHRRRERQNKLDKGLRASKGMASCWLGLCYMEVLFFYFSFLFHHQNLKHTVKVSLIVFFTPPPLFVHGGTPSWVVLLYLIAIQLMFQLGWATVQIGHLALIPQ